jgi:ABC-2 type transport system ATP-binding protein
LAGVRAVMTSVLSFTNVFKDYGKVRAINNLSLDIHEGKRVALLGSNGAGKSSFLSMASGLKRSTGGEVKVFSSNPSSLAVKKRMTYLPQELSFPENLKVKEILSIVEVHHDHSIANSLVSDLGMHNLLSRKTYQLSGGERRKLGLICNLLSSPEFVMLDEPTANIDVEGRQSIEEILKDYFRDNSKTLLFSSHQMKEVENLADEIVILRSGKIVARGPTQEIKKEFGAKKVIFTSDLELEIESSKSIELKDNLYTVLGDDSDEIIKEVIQKDANVKKISIEDPDLEEILMKLWNEEYIQ